MMEYGAFTNEVMYRMQQLLGSGYSVHVRNLLCNNGIRKDYLVISEKGVKTDECMPLGIYYELCVNQADMDMIIADMLKTYRKEKEKKHAVPESEVLDWNSAKGRIMFRLIGTQANREFLQDVPHIDFCDLSQVFYLMLEADGEGCRTVQVNNRLMEAWKVQEEDIRLCAERNMAERMPGKLAGLEEFLADAGGEYDGDGKGLSFYVLTNSMKLYGAGCILYKGMLESVAERIGFGFYVIPSSVHEVIIIPSDECSRKTAGELKCLLASVNGTELSECEILSDSVYYYNRKEHHFAVAA